MGWPANGRPSKKDTSWRVGAISPHRKWNVCVSGLHRSTRLVSREWSCWRRLIGVPTRSPMTSDLVASTNRAKGRSPAHFNLQNHIRIQLVCASTSNWIYQINPTYLWTQPGCICQFWLPPRVTIGDKLLGLASSLAARCALSMSLLSNDLPAISANNKTVVITHYKW
jgi:hypothetical protein